MFATALADFETKAGTVLASPQTLGGSSAAVYEKLGSLWADMRQELATLPEGQQPVVPEGRTLEEEIEDSVCESLGRLFAQHKPTITMGENTTRIPYRFATSIKSAYGKHWAVREASQHAQLRIMHSPERSDPLGPPHETPTPMPGDSGPDLIDTLLQRMMGTNPAESGLSSANPGSTGNGGKGTEVVGPTALNKACKRLTEVGVPALRVSPPLAPMLATAILQSKPTFGSYIESKNLTGSHGREADTLARSLDLGIAEMGVPFLKTGCAEVMIRRLMAVCLGTKMGHFRLAQLLEELPGDSVLAELPDALLMQLQTRLKLEMKLESLAAGQATGK